MTLIGQQRAANLLFLTETHKSDAVCVVAECSRCLSLTKKNMMRSSTTDMV